MSAKAAIRRRKQMAMNNRHLAKIGRSMYPKAKGQSSSREKREAAWRANKAKGLF